MLTNQHFLVTGAGSGIGAACSRFLAAAGAFVWVNDLRRAAAEETVDAIKGAGGGAQAIEGDVSEPSLWLEPILESGVLHGIVHCAGFDVASAMGDADMHAFDQALAAMVTGPFELSQRLLPNLTEARGACLVFIASVHALATEPGVSAYAAAKGALVSMVRSIAQDLGPRRIRAVAVSPGYVDTPLLDKSFTSMPDPQAARARANELHPLGRIGRPEDIAGLVRFLLSAEAEFINGSNVVIDGGLIAMLPQ